MNNYVRHVIIIEDTVQQLAQRYLKDANRWMEIVLINDLEYPFIVNETRNEKTSKKVICVGEEIIIPIEMEYAIDTMTKQQIKADYDRALGEDISVLSHQREVDLLEGGIAELTSTSKGDLKTVKGLKNLQQAIILRLATPKGSLLHHPNYGCDVYKYLGERDTYSSRTKIRIEIEKAVKCDYRVQDCEIETFTVHDGIVNVSLIITPIGIMDIIELQINLSKDGIIQWA